MAFYSEEIIEEVRSRNPVVDVIGSYVHLTKKGGSYFGLCPFHNEKSPSFSVSPSRQTYHCFGCGKGGNVITFVMDYENCSFPEAMEMLASRAGIELPKQEYTPEMKKNKDARDALLQMHKEAALFYVHELRKESGKLGRAYFEKRQLTEETIRSFGLGYAGQHTDVLYKYLKEKGYTDEQLKDSGLVTLKEKGAYDKFWNRVMFPIMDVNNRVIGFGGRVLGDGEPKYLNSPETKIFDKSRNLYGLNVARRTKEKYLLVCEGYMDVISMHQAGFTNAVASLGTAFTAQHGIILKRYTDEVILCYDNDGAGRKAILRAVPILKEAGLLIKVLDLSPYKDPDEFMKNLGREAFEERVKAAQNAFLFEVKCMRDDYDFSDPAEKSNYFNAVAKKLSEFQDPIERNAYTEAVAKQYGMEYEVLKKQVSAIGNRVGLMKETGEAWKPKRTETVSEAPAELAAKGLSVPKPSGVRMKKDGTREAEKMVLTYLSDTPSAFRNVREILTPQDFGDELMRNVASLLFEQLAGGKVNPPAIIDRFIADDRYAEVTEVLSSAFMADAPDADRRAAFSAAVKRVKIESLERESKASTDLSAIQEIGRKKQEVMRIEII